MFLSSSMVVTIPASRIVSLVPSQTELLYQFGLDAEVIGTTKFCIHPSEWHGNKIRVGGTKDIDIDKIKSLKPDLVIANREENVREQIEEVAESIPVWLTDVATYQQALAMIFDIGKLVDKTNQASALVQQIKGAFENSKLQASVPIAACYLIWKDPYMTVGNDTFISNMMIQAGFANVFSKSTRYPSVTIDDINQSGCEVLMLSSEPYPFREKHLAALQEMLPGIKILLVDGEMFSWYGSRMLLAPAYFMELQLRISRMEG